MKIGITINSSYVEYLEKIANLNNLTKTAICSLIVENFLSYNLRMKKFPKFQKAVRIVFDEKVVDGNFNSNSCVHRSCASDQDSEHSSLSRDEILKRLDQESIDVVPGDSESDFPFDYDSED